MKIPVEKNKKYIVDIVDNGFEGEGIAKIKGYTVFIPETIKGEQCEVLILKTTTAYAYGKVVKYLKKSNYRNKADCNTYKRCGGCNLRHIDYQYTLKMKKDKVQNLADKSLKTKLQVLDTIGMQEPYYYRNKAQFPVGYNKER